MESHRRSIYKALSWRVIATVITMIIAYLGTGSLVLAASIGAGDSAIKLLAYYLHERAWLNSDLGLESVDQVVVEAHMPGEPKTC